MKYYCTYAEQFVTYTLRPIDKAVMIQVTSPNSDRVVNCGINQVYNIAKATAVQLKFRTLRYLLRSLFTLLSL